MFEADVTVKDREGIHLRNAAALVRAASKFPKADLIISKDGHQVNGKSIMGVLTLVAEHGSTLHLRARGDDAEQLIEMLVGMFEAGTDA
jgi:phosphocarrier protein